MAATYELDLGSTDSDSDFDDVDVSARQMGSSMAAFMKSDRPLLRRNLLRRNREVVPDVPDVLPDVSRPVPSRRARRLSFQQSKMRVRCRGEKIPLSDPTLVNFEKQLRADGMHSRKRRRDVINHAAKLQLFLQTSDAPAPRRPVNVDVSSLCNTSKFNRFFEGRSRSLKYGGRRTLSNNVALWLRYLTKTTSEPQMIEHLNGLLYSVGTWRTLSIMCCKASIDPVDVGLSVGVAEVMETDGGSSTESDEEPGDFVKDNPVRLHDPVPSIVACRKYAKADRKQTKEQFAKAMQNRWRYDQEKLRAGVWVNGCIHRPSETRIREELRARKWHMSAKVVAAMRDDQ
jgi:hypothetical protein